MNAKLADIEAACGGAILKFGVFNNCPACHRTMDVRADIKTTYCEGPHIRTFARWGNSPYDVDTMEFSARPNPHLHRVCNYCQFEWLERTHWFNREDA